ncbi:NAD(P)/FAD-dependent oxidoreductase [Litoribrevibacter albus]|uniref:Pyridine nucleotide-disulfide oxidoreductase n=1 Tax=Litoribrevibacter albus TaxID=1473156 RepID=A0AA37SCP2_9GAMM|nr:FAD-dependent oxidoreductase [Litoribrevibacter albus]GLQ32979.1 pyridine nucleotide-disulfide oxidoreductase [Litoribrevibacter albus]
MTDKKELPIVILGSGLAGYGVAKEFRKLNTETPLLIITNDDGRSYSKPMLSAGFTKEKTAAALAMATAGDMATQLKASIRTQAEVTSIDPDAHTISLGEDTIEYCKLVIATGAKPHKAPMEGDGCDLVFSVNDLVDYDRFRQAAIGKKKVVIVGAGLIGCEFANDLRNGGYEVDVIAPSQTVLPSMLPEQPAQALRQGLEEAGVRFHLGALANRVIKNEDGVKVCLSNGEEIEADLVLSAIGLTPRVELAGKAGLAYRKGILVDRTLQTSEQDIYALGDCAEVDGLVLLYVLPLMASARALAKTLNDDITEVQYGAMPVVVKTPACPTVIATPTNQDGEWVVEGEGQDLSCKFLDADGKLKGFVLTGAKVVDKLALSKELPPMLG